MNAEVHQFMIDSLREMNYEVNATDDSTLLGPDGLDLESLAVAELALRVEDTYRVKFGDDEMEKLALMTISEFVDEIVARLDMAEAEALPQ